MRGGLLRLGVAVATLHLALAAAAGVPAPPKPDRYVTDGSGVLAEERARALDATLREFERRTSTQVLVWIAPRVPEGTTLEELGAEAIRAWGVGQKEADNGAIFFLFTEDRQMRIATGYGLEGALPDARARRILAEVVRPRLAAGDVAGGVQAAVDEILKAAAKEPYQGTGRTSAEERGAGSARLAVGAFVILFLGAPIAVALALRRGAARRRREDRLPLRE
jgi:uncharacterized protein